MPISTVYQANIDYMQILDEQGNFDEKLGGELESAGRPGSRLRSLRHGIEQTYRQRTRPGLVTQGASRDFPIVRSQAAIEPKRIA